MAFKDKFSSRPKSLFTRTVTKPCPECDQQIPVACKTCPCGYQFPSKRTSATPQKEAIPVEKKRRRMSERTKRERPDYFNSLELELPRRRRTVSSSSRVPVTSSSNSSGKRGRGRPKGSPNKPKEESPQPGANQTETDKEENVYETLTAEKALQYSVILAELNRKFGAQNFRPL